MLQIVVSASTNEKLQGAWTIVVDKKFGECDVDDTGREDGFYVVSNLTAVGDVTTHQSARIHHQNMLFAV